MGSRGLLAATGVVVAMWGCAPADDQTGGYQQYSHIYAAGQLGLGYLVTATVNWQNANAPCFACHSQGMSMWGASIGVQRGYDVDPALLSQIVSRVEDTQRPDGWWTHEAAITPQFTTAFAASGLAFYDRHVATDAQATLMEAAEWLRTRQAADGSWPSDSVWDAGRSEVFRSHDVFVTMASVIVMARVFEISFMPVYGLARDEGVAWLSTASDNSTQGLSFKLIGLREGGMTDDDEDVVDASVRLLSYQNGDGGFGLGPGEPSTAYHTGLAIYTLRLAGMHVSEPAIAQGIQWLLDDQNVDGSWPIGAAHLDATDPVAPSMWPVIALGEFGEFGVVLTADPAAREIAAASPTIQIVEYTITVTNRGSSADTYDLGVSGGLVPFSTALSSNEVTLGAGASAEVTLYVLAPRDLPPGLPVLHTVTAVSRSDADVTGSVTVNTYTPPVTTLEGHATMTELLAGFGTSIGTGDQVRIAARVTDLFTGAAVSGGGMGAVNFFVAGLAVGGDDDADGDGIFEITWQPGVDWSKLGAQSVMAVYSGINRPDPQYDLVSSFDVEDIVIEPTTDSACGNTAILVDEALTIFRGMDVNLPADAPEGIGNKIKEIIEKLEDVLAHMNEGNCRAAQSKLRTVFPQLGSTIKQIEQQSCSSKGGNRCIDDALAVILIDDLRAARELLDRVLDVLLGP
jgi:hypothetical protein